MIQDIRPELIKAPKVITENRRPTTSGPLTSFTFRSFFLIAIAATFHLFFSSLF